MASTVAAPIRVINKAIAQTETSCVVIKNSEIAESAVMVKPTINIFLSPILSEYLPRGNGKIKNGMSMKANIWLISIQVKCRWLDRYIGV